MTDDRIYDSIYEQTLYMYCELMNKHMQNIKNMNNINGGFTMHLKSLAHIDSFQNYLSCITDKINSNKTSYVIDHLTLHIQHNLFLNINKYSSQFKINSIDLSDICVIGVMFTKSCESDIPFVIYTQGDDIFHFIIKATEEYLKHRLIYEKMI